MVSAWPVVWMPFIAHKKYNENMFPFIWQYREITYHIYVICSFIPITILR